MAKTRNFHSKEFARALKFAAKLHRSQVRKQTEIPYITHLLIVSAFVWEAGGDETAAIAALLHDAAEDQGGRKTLRRIQRKFGSEVADIVEACSDAIVSKGESKADYAERKRAHLAKLNRPETHQRVILVTLADKLHNCQAIVHEFEVIGPAVWSKFNGTRQQIAWYYQEILDLAQRRAPDNELTRRLEEWVPRLQAAAD